MDAPGGRVETQVAGIQARRGGVGGPPVQGTEPGQELVEGERLGQVVIGPGVQAGDPVRHFAAGGQHQDWDADPALTQGPAHVQAVQPRQHQVEHEAVVARGGGLDQSLGAGVPDLHLMPGLAQALGEQIGEAPLVLDHQHPHLLPPPWLVLSAVPVHHVRVVLHLPFMCGWLPSVQPAGAGPGAEGMA
ncbi:MAG: hypothetical protein QOJ50_2499 [Cryptosporangiaceae bacterium]|nr:hypothetical protein [Cryptosporangiaceae bacterium]